MTVTVWMIAHPSSISVHIFEMFCAKANQMAPLLERDRLSMHQWQLPL